MRRYEGAIRSLLVPDEWRRYEQDAERGTLTRLLRAAELARHDVDHVLRRAIEGRDFAGARSIAAVLHGRVRRIVGTPEPRASDGYSERTPAIQDPGPSSWAGRGAHLSGGAGNDLLSRPGRGDAVQAYAMMRLREIPQVATGDESRRIKRRGERLDVLAGLGLSVRRIELD